MSIPPSDAQRPAQFPNPHLPRNPSSSHGARHRSDRRSQPGAAVSGRAAVPVPAPSPAPSSSPGSTHGVYGVSCDSTRSVIESGAPDAAQDSYLQSRDTLSQCQSTRGISSPFRSDESGLAPTSEIPSETANVIQSDHLVSGSNGLQVNAVQSNTRRNQVVNANHLLNFHYDRISRPQPRTTTPRRQQKIRPYNKDLFLQANYKFVMLDTGSYQLESVDPDRMLQWDDVICVRYSTPLPVHCPICLESPLCPQITSCGHIYCFPCMLQYLLMGKEDHKGEIWKKCPLCFMMISSKDLHTIRIDEVKQFHVGNRAYFALLSRPKDSLVPSLKNQQGLHLLPSTSSGICDPYSRFILTSDVELSVREAKSDLNDWLCKADSGLVDDLEKLPYVCTALEQLEERMKNWMDHRALSGSPPLRSSASLSSDRKVGPKSSNSDSFDMGSGTPNTILECEATDSSEKLITENLPFPLAALPNLDENSEKLHGNTNNCKDVIERDSYTFYQAMDGQHLILHPLNMKCLLHHYGNHDLLPQRISGEILELETVTQTEAIRKRYRYLSHFSLTTTFQLCEIDLSEIVPQSSLAPFMDEIKKRQKQRKRLAKLALEERARAEAAVLPDWPVPPGQIRLSHNDTIFSLDDFTALGSGVAPSTSPPITTERKLFSNVTRLGFAAAHDSPSLKSEESADSLERSEKTGETSSIQGSRRPEPTVSFASIISAAKPTENPENQKANGFGKKGKKSSKLLMSTSGGRRY